MKMIDLSDPETWKKVKAELKEYYERRTGKSYEEWLKNDASGWDTVHVGEYLRRKGFHRG